MRVRFWLPAVSSAALVLIGFSAGPAHAGSFFGPNCYGANYAYEYPNRAHNVFGFGPCTQCQARHPLFKHRWARKHANDGAPANAMMAPNGMPINGMPANGMMTPNSMPANVMMTLNGMPNNSAPVEYVQAPSPQQLPVVQPAPVTQAPIVETPAQTTSLTTPASAQPIPATSSSRITPIPARLPKGPARPEPPAEESSGKPPF